MKQMVQNTFCVQLCALSSPSISLTIKVNTPIAK